MTDILLGWCNDRKHKECRIRLQRFMIGTIGKGRGRREGVIWLDDWIECSCYCHTGDEPPKKKTTRKTTARRKK